MLDTLIASLLMTGKLMLAKVAPSCELSLERGFCLRLSLPPSGDRTTESSTVSVQFLR